MPYAADGYGVGAVNVRPEARRQGVGTALFEATVDSVRGRVPGTQLNHAAVDRPASAAAAAWGLRETGRHQESVLDLTSLDWHELYAFVNARYREAPDAVGGAGLPYDEFRAMGSRPWMLATARDGAGAYLGFTVVMDHAAKPHGTNTFFTGVVAEARGRGIATALKCHQAR